MVNLKVRMNDAKQFNSVFAVSDLELRISDVPNVLWRHRQVGVVAYGG